MMEIVGYKTEDGFKFFFNEKGELTDGDITFVSSKTLLADIDAEPIYVSEVFELYRK